MKIDKRPVKLLCRRNGYYIFNAKKPIREDWAMYKVIHSLKLSVRVFKKAE